MPTVKVERPVYSQSHGSEAELAHLRNAARALSRLKPWAGHVPKGYIVDFLGTLIDAEFRAMWGIDPATAGGEYVETRMMSLSEGEEGWFEAANWALAAEEARERFVMISLGAQFGTQSVGSYLALQQLNPMPCKLVAVEPEPGNFIWLKKHFTDNGIDPKEHWLLQMAINDTHDPVLFPIGASGHGAHNCMMTNSLAERDVCWRELMEIGKPEESLRELLMTNSTGLKKGILGEGSEQVEIKYISVMTLPDILGPFDFVDYLEADIQTAETAVLPPAIDLLKRKVRRMHIGTHRPEGHRQLHRLFEDRGWTIVFSYEPYSTYETALGTFSTDDGILTVTNPALAAR